MNTNNQPLSDKQRPTVAIAGASGFVGRHLIEALKSDYDLIGLTRHDKKSEPGLEWRRCDLFSLLQAEQALEGADYAVYLVHSMMPKSGLTQASFADMDLILADNFARAAKKAGVQQIVYLGGIIPRNENPDELSEHLRSRHEVEHVLAAYDVPLTALRASIVIGPHGSSFEIVEKLVQRLPIMIAPGWTQTPTQPIAQRDVMEIIHYVIGRPDAYHQAFDIGGPDVVSYLELMQATSRELEGRERLILPVPLFAPRLSYLWVSLITGAPKELISPLIESLQFPMVANQLTLQTQMGQKPLSLQAAIQLAVRQEREAPKPAPEPPKKSQPQKKHADRPDKHVRSVQRLPIQPGKDALWLADKYTLWLPRLLRPFVRVDVAPDYTIRFYILGIWHPILELDYSESRSTPDRALYYITGGLLSQQNEERTGRLEFRVVPGGKFALAAIHEFTPSLPWVLYQFSQARIHLWVMNAFIRYLKNLDPLPETPAGNGPKPPKPIDKASAHPA